MRRHHAVPAAGRIGWLLLAVIVSVGCGSAIAPEATTDGPAEPAGAAAGTPRADALSQGDEPAMNRSGSPPAVRALLETDAQGHVALVVRVEGTQEVSLQRRITAATAPEAGAEPVDLALGAECGAPEGCLTLVPGAEVRPAALSDLLGDRCACERCPELAAGARLLVRTCDGTHIVRSAALP